MGSFLSIHARTLEAPVLGQRGSSPPGRYSRSGGAHQYEGVESIAFIAESQAKVVKGKRDLLKAALQTNGGPSALGGNR